MMQLRVTFRQQEKYRISLEEKNKSFRADLGQIQTVTKIEGDIEQYDGPYEVTPDAHAPVILGTSNKILAEDVTVKKIPYYQTSNPSGDTVYIASEVE